jgi:NAD(P)-dependent dehydrogenase (short-subunit alcohol dehydrogenase family)
MSKAALEVMIEQGGGVIINNASYFGLVGGRGTAAYSASKGAVVLLTKAMALDHASNGIRVNCVCAGSVDTPMLQGEMEEMGGEAAVRHLFEDKHPLGRIASPHEIAQAVLYLASDDAAFVTGAALPIDGGLTAG